MPNPRSFPKSGCRVFGFFEKKWFHDTTICVISKRIPLQKLKLYGRQRSWGTLCRHQDRKFRSFFDSAGLSTSMLTSGGVLSRQKCVAKWLQYQRNLALSIPLPTMCWTESVDPVERLPRQAATFRRINGWYSASPVLRSGLAFMFRSSLTL